VNRVVYDHTVEWLRDAVTKARIGHSDRLHALRRLTDLTGSANRAPTVGRF
jgi:hypothetical protein